MVEVAQQTDVADQQGMVHETGNTSRTAISDAWHNAGDKHRTNTHTQKRADPARNLKLNSVSGRLCTRGRQIVKHTGDKTKVTQNTWIPRTNRFWP